MFNYISYRYRSLNFGAIGSTMGHEQAHGFDSIGRKFDPNGNKKTWWDDDSIANFKENEECFIKKFSKYKFNNKWVYIIIYK